MATPPIFPVYPGGPLGAANQAWPVKKAPSFATRIQKGVSGRELRALDQSYPIWEFTLDFGLLRDKWDTRAGANVGFGAGHDELRTLLGFYLGCQGAFIPFVFWDPTDNTVTGQSLAPGDGATTRFQMYRQLVSGGIAEPVVAADDMQTVNVYLDGVLQDPSSYGYDSTLGYTRFFDTLVFTTPPGAGVTVTADFSYWFLCRFSEDQAEFSNDLYQLWTTKGLKFRSVLP